VNANTAMLQPIANAYSYPLLFAVVSGAHLYGFPSPDSDYDFRGMHILPQRIIYGLEVSDETLQATKEVEGYEIDMMTHDARKYFQLLLKKSGDLLEQTYSPLIVTAQPEFEEVRDIMQRCITRHYYHHYSGFASRKWHDFEEASPRRVKPLLYTYRVLLTGIHLMRTGLVEANLLHLNELFKLPYIPDLVARKLSGAEASILSDVDMDLHRAEFLRLRAELDAAFAETALPEAPTARREWNDLLIRIRIKYG
jgi:uncharacterized protein